MELKDKVQFGLDENRILVLGAQLLLGFQFRSIFEPGFERLSRLGQWVDWAGLGAMSLAIIVLVTAPTFHRIAEGGEDTARFDRVLTLVMFPALLPFVFGLSSDFFLVGERLGGRRWAVGLSLAAALVGLLLLYGWELVARSRHPAHEAEMKEKSSLKDRLRHVLTEARLVIPGAQALLGFQFIVVLMDSFEKLPRAAKLLHLASLSAVALAIVLLMATAAYHRIVERGEETEHMHRLASALVLWATVPLGLGIAGDFAVVTYKVFQRWDGALLAGFAMLAVTYGAWFGLGVWGRARRGVSG